MSTRLEHAGRTIHDPTDADIATATKARRGDDWTVSLYRGEADFMEVMLEDGGLTVEAEGDGRFARARLRVDDRSIDAMLASFRDGKESWRDMAPWKEAPPPLPKKPPVSGGAKLVLGLAALVPVLVAAIVWTGHVAWLAVLFALAFPTVIAVATWVKVAETRRAKGWKPAKGRVVRSELVAGKRFDRKVQLPAIEYEFSVGLRKFTGKRVSFAEIIPGPEVPLLLARYPVGMPVTLYYDPANPSESVIDREFPPMVHAAWGVVGVMVAAIAFGAWWFLLR